jgi:hypothetical protein
MVHIVSFLRDILPHPREVVVSDLSIGGTID